jgi:hypothetical protein
MEHAAPPTRGCVVVLGDACAAFTCERSQVRNPLRGLACAVPRLSLKLRRATQLRVDYGDLAEVTAGCIGTGSPDAAFPADFDAFPGNSPAFGNPDFCE